MSAPTLLTWLEAPSTRTGVNFGTPDGSWHRYSYDELARLSRRAAHALTAAGVGRDDIVALVLPSSPAFLAAFFGALLAGATPAPLAPPVDGAPAAMGYDDRMSALLTAARPRAVIADRTPGHHLPADIHLLDSAGLLDPAHERDTGPGRIPAARGLVQFTSGSGGRARGVALDATALAGHVAAIRDWLEAAPGAVWASWLPVHHDMGLVGCLLGAVLAQDELWLMRPEAFVRRPLEYLRCFGLRGASISATPAFGLDHILRKVRPEHLTGLDFAGWRSLVVGAERIPPATLRDFHALLGLHGLRRGALLPAYGLAEASLAVTGLRHGQQWTEEKSVVGCGSPLPGTTVRIVDDDGRDLPDRTVGEIAVRGPQLALGHLGDDVRDTRITDGELRTGDAGFLADGQLFVHGRIGDGLKLRGQWVFAEDVEQALGRAGLLPARAVVVLGEDATGPVAALVVEDGTGTPDPAADDAVRRLLRHTVPGADTLLLRVARGALPRTPSGKPRRRTIWHTLVENAADHPQP
ncbi:AMP-binding protein [Streptomyces sp. NPDC006314]|uniref:AMP-binding protein n=1 Tax=Streptomyces sp. NPDC006314 TaxID=3154475 RepID=UPI0033A37632